MYLKMFGLKEKPFHITPDPRFIFLSKGHKEAFAHLLYGVNQGVGFLSLTGEVGTGKTTVLRTLLRQLEMAEYRLALIFNPCLSALELLQSIHREFDIPCQAGEQNLASLHDSLNLFLLEQRKRGNTVVLVVDEAQNLEVAVLEQLRLLSNLETETDKLLQLIIVGQPELEEILERRELRQLKQRLVVRYRLTRMDAGDTEAYILHRLKIAGFTGGKLFSEKALKKIFDLTGGLPRLINILCDRALLVAYTQEQNQINHRIIMEAQAELTTGEKKKQSAWSLIALSSIFLGLLLLLFLDPNFLPDAPPEPEPRPISAVVSPGIAPNIRPEALQAEEIDAEKLDQFKRRISSFSEKESAIAAVSGVLKLWEKPALENFIPDSYQALDLALQKKGMDTIRFANNLEKLINFNSPAVLTILLPNLKGKRYLALLKVNKNLVLTEPALSDDGWIPLGYLKDLWFGNAIIPWENLEKLPSIDEPGVTFKGVEKIQELLIQAGYVQQEITGTFDSETIEAISDLQHQTGLDPDGRVGSQTLFQLYRRTGKKMPALNEEVLP